MVNFIQPYKKKLAIIDADFLPFFCCYNKDDSYKKTLEDCINTVDNFITNILVGTKSELFTGFLTKGKCFRYGVNPDYKANRKYLNLPDYLNETKKYLEDKYNFTYKENFEADDLCESLRKQLNNEYECILVSPDKDLLNLTGTNYNPRTHELSIISKFETEYNFWISMLVGKLLPKAI